MRSSAARVFVAAAVVASAASAACDFGASYHLANEDGGVVADASSDVSSDGAPRDAQSDGTPGSDGGAGCSAFPGALLCDDFDRSQVLSSSWRTAQGTITIDSTSFVSPSHAALLVVGPKDAGGYQSGMSQTISGVASLTVSCDFFFEAAELYHEPITVSFSSPTGHRYVFDIEGNFDIPFAIDERIDTAAQKVTTGTSNLGDFVGGWHRFALRLMPATIELTVDGVVHVSAMASPPAWLADPTTTADIIIEGFVQAPTRAARVHIDNVAVTSP